MTNQDERFWSEFSADELKDPVDRQVLSALRDVYHIDEDDRQSVQRAWGNLSARMDQDEQQKSVSHALTAPLALLGTKNPAHTPRSPMRRRVDTLVALCIIFLLVGSMIGVIAHYQSQSSTLAGHPTPVPTQLQPTSAPIRPQQLGTHLDSFFLGMSIKDLQANGLCLNYNYLEKNLLRLYCEKGSLIASFNTLPAVLPDSKVVQLVAWGGFPGRTTEGLSLGMSLEQFRTLYRQFKITSVYKAGYPFPLYFQDPSPSIVFSITDGNGVTLWVLFNRLQQVAQIVLQSDNANNALPLTLPTAVG